MRAHKWLTECLLVKRLILVRRMRLSLILDMIHREACTTSINLVDSFLESLMLCILV